jgi:ADP-dependent NAD(P)H-hydrate dehydratase / NAD(P)H-hydrate epimerase
MLNCVSRVPVISVEQMREWEKATWASGKTEREVTQNVGQILAQRLLEVTQPGDAIWILAGKGHNGDDARASQPHLSDRNVVLINVEDPVKASVQFSQLAKTTDTRHVRWLVDGLFGIGLNRPLDREWGGLIDAVNGYELPIFAVDVPSGLNADTGKVEGAAIKATITLTLGAPKRGLLESPNTVGRLEVATDIGLVPCPFETELYWSLSRDFVGWPPRREVVGNKGDYGHVAIIAGSLGYHGAAVLAAHGAMRAQPGLVTVFPQPSVYVPVASQLHAAMVHPWRADMALPKNCTSILFGPGLAAEGLPEAVQDEMRSLWRYSPTAMVVDASALSWLAATPVSPLGVRVITPHPGEAGRLVGGSAKDVQTDRLAALRALSKRFSNCWVVLKGHQTLIGRAEGEVFINGSGNPHLAQGGSGDLLGGYLAGLLAQPEWRKESLLALRYGVWQHGATADYLDRTQPNWTVEDLARHLGRIKP